MDKYNWRPANIFLGRDAEHITSRHGEIKIHVVGGEGWRAYKADTLETLISGQDVWSMCAWLINNDAEPQL